MSSENIKQQIIMDDEKIIDLYWQREETAIYETDKKYGRFIFCIAYNILNDRSDCEECQNDTYLGVWNAIPPTRPMVFPAFIAQIVRRKAINRYKEKTSKKRIPSELTVSMEDFNGVLTDEAYTDKTYEAEELGKIISDYVRSLSERRRYIFIGRYYMVDSVESLAKDLRVSVATVYREIDKIKQGLKSHLERSGLHI